MLISYQGHRPKIGKNVFIAPTASIIGNVVIHDNASIWFNAVIRGDLAPIEIGTDTNIQDNCTIHNDEGYPVNIGNRVIVGHNAVIHGCTIEDHCLIGIGAVILNQAHIKKGSIIAAGSVVTSGATFGPWQLAAGTPAVVKKDLPADSQDSFNHPVKDYLKLSAAYQNMEW